MTAGTTPLITRSSSDIIAQRRGRAVTVGEFLVMAHGQAQALPEASGIINVCEDRFGLLVGFAAALMRGLPTLLPPNPLVETIDNIHARWPGSYVLCDRLGERSTAPQVQLNLGLVGSSENPRIQHSAMAAVVFTSGTTGSSLPQEKTWRLLVEGTAINLRYYLGANLGPWTVVSTVPGQHMYGLETTLLSAMHGPVCMHDGRPFYPASVVKALEEAPPPRLLVSTPVHLRALVGSGLAFPRVARVLSATAPLDDALAASLRHLFSGELVEIYGCSEVGSMAWRCPAVGAPWHFFEGLQPETDGDMTTIDAAHLPKRVRLPDKLEFDKQGGFILVGRDSDLVKIGGKRCSLAEVTRLLLGVPGVKDAVVFRVPGASEHGRLAALVVAENQDSVGLRIALRRVLDPVFIPRPIRLVPALPRSAAGKLSHEAMLRLYAATNAGRSASD